MNNIFPLNLAEPSDELKKLIAEHPDYPIVVLVDEDATVPDYSYTYCSSISFDVSTILDCEAVCQHGYIYTDKDELLQDMFEYLAEKYSDISDEELDKLTDAEVAKYDEYWKDVICIWASN